MVELNHRERTIKVKIVYYGPPVGGKTTNLQVLHQHALAARRGELISVNSAQDRTILFDLLPLKGPGFRGFTLLLQLLAVPGQAMYSATRRLVLKGADSVVFVANSAADRWQENIQSFREMTQNLITFQLDPANLPLVLQYNKRDLPEVTPIEVMDRALNARKVDSLPAVAVRGEGVLETFTAILMRTMKDLSSRYQILDSMKGQSLTQWTNQTVAGMFGATALATEPHPLIPAPPTPGPLPPPPEGWAAERRTVRVALPEDAVSAAGAGPDARANETLVDSYVQASTQLSTALTDVRAEREVARRRLEDLQHALTAAQEVLTGQPLEPTLRGVISRMAEAAGGSHASFLIQEPDRSLKTAAVTGIPDDPLLRTPAGVRHILGKLLTDSEPRVHHAVDNLDLGDALESGQPPFASVLSVPVRTPRGLQGLAMLYFTADAAIPGPDVVAHLSSISRALSSPMELARAFETVQAAERSLQLALAGTASVKGVEEVVSFLEELRDRLGTLRHRPEAPAFFLEEFARLSPSLAGALTTARSLLAFSRGEIQKEIVSVEDLVSEVRVEGDTAQLGPGADAVSGDAVLLRLALRALLAEARGVPVAVGASSAVHIRAVAEGGQIRISVFDKSEPSEATRPGDARRVQDASVTLVRRIAELHGGSLTLEGQGAAATRYTLNLLPG